MIYILYRGTNTRNYNKILFDGGRGLKNRKGQYVSKFLPNLRERVFVINYYYYHRVE